MTPPDPIDRLAEARRLVATCEAWLAICEADLRAAFGAGDAATIDAADEAHHNAWLRLRDERSRLVGLAR